jgi:CO dehydrogenase maturation factor
METICIALAGKGGVGKTTVTGLILDCLAKAGKGPILAVDADPNANLNEVLGLERAATLGDIREEIAKGGWMEKNPIPPGMSKQEYADFRFGAALVEEDNFDMMVMGRTQGKGCYCYVNDLLRDQIQKYYKNYRYLIVDNEAGLEHISRGILPPVDYIILVSDASRRGIQAAGRIAEMIGELDLKVKSVKLIVNRAPGGKLEPGVEAEIAAQKLELAGILPQDDAVYQYDAEGKPLVQLPDDSPVRRVLEEIIKKMNL